jgi:methyltransferase (TIGR00027 family)
MEPLLQNISDTARWVAVFRAEESERPDAIFHDPFARRLAGERGEQIADALSFSRKNSWSFVARTFLFDDIVKKQVAEGFDTVINLAAGLDTRPYRMELPATLRWIEVDLPGILDYKESVLAGEKPVCQLESIRLDLADKDQRLSLLRQLGKQTTKALVITEGLMIYLDAGEATELAGDLSEQTSFRRWAFDIVSPPLLAISQKEMGPVLKQANIVFKFAPENGEAFFHPYGWQSIASYSKLKTAATLNRLPEEMLGFASMPEPEGPIRPFPWTGVCLFENMHTA